MSEAVGHDEIRDLLGAYALDAVDPGERELVDAHLEECGECRDEAAQHLETASFLAAEPDAAPAHLWDRIAGSLPTPIEPRRADVARWKWATAALAVAAAAFAGIALGAMTDGDDPSKSAREVALISPDLVTSIRLVHFDDGSGFVDARDLAGMPGDLTYQLWAFQGDEPTSAGVLGPDPGIAPFQFDGDADTFAITVEPKGGSPAPTKDPIVVGS